MGSDLVSGRSLYVLPVRRAGRWVFSGSSDFLPALSLLCEIISRWKYFQSNGHSCLFFLRMVLFVGVHLEKELELGGRGGRNPYLGKQFRVGHLKPVFSSFHCVYSLSACASTSGYACLYAQMRVWGYERGWMCVYVSTCKYVCVYERVSACVHAFMFIRAWLPLFLGEGKLSL